MTDTNYIPAFVTGFLSSKEGISSFDLKTKILPSLQGLLCIRGTCLELGLAAGVSVLLLLSESVSLSSSKQ